MSDTTKPSGAGGNGGGGSDGDGEFDAAFALRWMDAAARAVDGNADWLTELDSPIGDADHGTNLRRGFAAAQAALEKDPPATPGAVLMLAGRQLVSTVGGASGPLFGTLLRRTGKALGDAPQVSRQQLAEALQTAVGAVGQLGGAVAGDATMLDALIPAAEALATAEEAPFVAARAAAEEGALATVPLQARKGRASYLGERSVGHEDPGAASSALLIAALAEATGATGECTRQTE